MLIDNFLEVPPLHILINVGCACVCRSFHWIQALSINVFHEVL